MKREEVKELVERGVRELNEALAAGKSDRLQQYLDVMARFPRYSFNNCILISLQFPDARMVQGFHAWKKLGRSVKKDEKGIGIIAQTAELSGTFEERVYFRGQSIVIKPQAHFFISGFG